MLIKFEHLLHKYNIRPTGVLHCGGHWGEEAPYYFNAGVDNAIFIEAIPDEFKKLCRNLSEYPRMAAINACVGEVDGEHKTFHISNNEGQSSSLLDLGYHKTAHPEVHYIKHIPVVTKRLDTLLNEYQINVANYDFLNMDLQGSELSALKSMGELLHKVKYAYLEANWKELYKGCALIDELKEYMSNFGFISVEEQQCGNTGWGDIFLIKQIN